MKARKFPHWLVRSLGALCCLALIVALPLAASAKTMRMLPTKESLTTALKGSLPQLTSGLPFKIDHPQWGPLWVESTIDAQLQAKAREIMSKVKDKRAALVVLDASTGKVLAMAGVNNGRLDPRVALDHRAPSASLFKIVTAAAAMEEAALEPYSELGFVGQPHTLYHSQLREQYKVKPRKVTLRESFADSNNPVFARLGIYRLGSQVLKRYGNMLGYEQPLGFEVPVGQSRMYQPKTNFNVGEMACGYNRVTSMSPLHAALMVAPFVNGGHLPQPWVVQRMLTPDGQVVYRGQPHLRRQVIEPTTCQAMTEMMDATVEIGTARKVFKRIERDEVLRYVDVGGKTGTIRGPSRKELYKWFAGYGRHRASGRTLVVAALNVYGNRQHSGPRELARQILKEAFRPEARYVNAEGRGKTTKQ